LAETEDKRNEAGLLSRLERGDEDAFNELYRRHQTPVYRYLLRMSGSEAVAEDVVQEVFLALIRGARGYNPSDGPLGSYLFGMARNMLLRRWRSEPATEEPDDSAAAPDGDPLEGLTQAESVEQLRRALLSLPPHYRDVVVLCELEEMSYMRAAEMMGVPVGTVRSRLSRARAMLLERMSGSRVQA
jgi:RNA polymerase sigma-70 factor, ECF subfamily